MDESWRKYEALAAITPEVKKAYQALKDAREHGSFDEQREAQYKYDLTKIEIMALLQEIDSREQINT